MMLHRLPHAKGCEFNIAHASVTDHRAPESREPPVGRITVRTLPIVGSAAARVPTGEEPRAAISQCTRPICQEADDSVGRSTPITRDRAAETSLTRWPGRDAGCALATARVGRGEAAESQSCGHAASLAPESVSALSDLIEAASAAGEFDAAEEAAGKCIRLESE